MTFRAEIPEKLQIAAQFADEGVIQRDGIDEIPVIAAVAAVPQATERRFHSEIEAVRQFPCGRKVKEVCLVKGHDGERFEIEQL